MYTELKKSFFGGYNKKITDILITQLNDAVEQAEANAKSAEMELRQIKDAQHRQQEELDLIKKEIDMRQKTIQELDIALKDKNDQISALENALEEQDRVMKEQNEKNQNDDFSVRAEYEKKMNRIGQIFTYAYDCASIITKQTQKEADAFVSSLFCDIDQSYGALRDLLVNINEKKQWLSHSFLEIQNGISTVTSEIDNITEEESKLDTAYSEMQRSKDAILANIQKQISRFAKDSERLIYDDAGAEPLASDAFPGMKNEEKAGVNRPAVNQAYSVDYAWSMPAQAPVSPAAPVDPFIRQPLVFTNTERPAATAMGTPGPAFSMNAAPESAPVGAFTPRPLSNDISIVGDESVPEKEAGNAEPDAVADAENTEDVSESAQDDIHRKPSIKEILEKYSRLR